MPRRQMCRWRQRIRYRPCLLGSREAAVFLLSMRCPYRFSLQKPSLQVTLPARQVHRPAACGWRQRISVLPLQLAAVCGRSSSGRWPSVSHFFRSTRRFCTERPMRLFGTRAVTSQGLCTRCACPRIQADGRWHQACRAGVRDCGCVTELQTTTFNMASAARQAASRCRALRLGVGERAGVLCETRVCLERA